MQNVTKTQKHSRQLRTPHDHTLTMFSNFLRVTKLVASPLALPLCRWGPFEPASNKSSWRTVVGTLTHASPITRFALITHGIDCIGKRSESGLTTACRSACRKSVCGPPALCRWSDPRTVSPASASSPHRHITFLMIEIVSRSAIDTATRLN